MILATLGPGGTCSEIVLGRHLSRFAPSASMRLYDSYEQAIEAVVAGDAAAAVIAAAYPRLNEFVMEVPRRVVIVDCFVAETPALVLAGPAAMQVPELSGRGVACATATVPLARTKCPNSPVYPALSNAHAAQAVLAGIADAAITTEPAACAAGLEIFHSFGPLPMAWVVLQAVETKVTGDGLP